MRTAVVGRILLGLGLVVGIAAGVGLLIGFEPARLPPALLNIAAYKLTVLAAAGLLAAGAVVLRHARRDGEGAAPGDTRSGSARALGEGRAEDVPVVRAHETERARMKDRTGEPPR